MKVILTEKPSVARDIAKCLNINNKRDGYFEGNGYQITWAFGHLVELKEPMNTILNGNAGLWSPYPSFPNNLD